MPKGEAPNRRYGWPLAILLVGLLTVPATAAWSDCDSTDPSGTTRQQGQMTKTDKAVVDAGTAAVEAESKSFSMDELIERLKKSDAIGFLTKLTLRSDAVDLVDMVKAYKRDASRYSLADLHARFNGLLLKVLALLNDDPKLSKDISMAREDIWKSLMEVKA
ncbi:MAG TPA: hypothetical protein VJ961_05825 [Mariprofundaceae bacterium]|nr:hypothetical protein [Mariprofundaceae bacterium]